MIATVRRAKTFVGDTIGNDTIVINIETGAYYSLSSDAGKLWNLCEAGSHNCPSGLEDVAAQLVAEGILSIEAGDLPDGTGASFDPAFVKYTDMSDILLADPIHDVDDEGWPKLR